MHVRVELYRNYETTIEGFRVEGKIRRRRV
jgi:hypothetical protein